MLLPEGLDIRTLLLVSGLISLLNALAMAGFARRFRQFPGIAWVALADLMLCLGMGLVAMRDYWPEWLTTVAANLFTLGGLIVNAEGFRRYLDAEWHWWSRPYFLFLLLLPGSAWFTFVEPNVNARVLLFSGCAAVTLGVIAARLWLATSGTRLRFVTVVFAAFAAFMALRWCLTWTESPLGSFMAAGWLHALALLAYLVFVLGKNFGILQDSVKCLLRDIEEQARTDPLTGLLNRRALQASADILLAQAKRRGAPVTAIMLDIDHFKSINDHHGHAAGDTVLRGVAALLRQSLRAGDVCARFGGEEFLLLLPDTRADAGEQVAEKLRVAVAAADFGGIERRTASFGVADAVDGDLDALLRDADRALYVAKAAGRDQVARAT